MPDKRIKLIWDFYGPDAEKTAIHHVTHLNSFALSEQLNHPVTGVDTISNLHSCAFLVVDQDRMIIVRDALKPHRGQYFSES